MSEQLWSIYQQTYFQWRGNSFTAGDFSIISARNPCGQIHDAKINTLLHRQLQHDLQQQAKVFALILAGDKHFHFSELSLAIRQTLPEAIGLATKYRQNALFWVSEQQLQLVPALMQPWPTVSLGHFRHRLIAN